MKINSESSQEEYERRSIKQEMKMKANEELKFCKDMYV